MKRLYWIAGAVFLVFVVPLFGQFFAGDEQTASRPRLAATITVWPTSTPTLERWKIRAEEIPYADLLRYAEQHKGKLVYFRGEVIFVSEYDNFLEIKVSVSPPGASRIRRDDVVLLKYHDPAIRVLDDDKVEFVARMEGIWAFDQIPEATVVALKFQ